MGREPCCWGDQQEGEIQGPVWKCVTHRERLTLENQFTQWAGSSVRLEIAGISFALFLAGSVTCFPTQREYLQHMTKYSIRIQWLEEPHSQVSQKRHLSPSFRSFSFLQFGGGREAVSLLQQFVHLSFSLFFLSHSLCCIWLLDQDKDRQGQGLLTGYLVSCEDVLCR